ncbi:MAG: hypothetical protein ACI9OJ_003971, partial [Myxococcota bacterium]
MSMRVSIALFSAALVLCAGCKSKPDIAELEGWVRAGNSSKVRDFAIDTGNETELRLAAVGKLIEYGLTMELQEVLKGLGSDRDSFVKAVADSLLAEMTGEFSEAKLEAKNALFVVLPYLKDERQDSTLAAVADWAFGGIDENTDRVPLVRRVEQYEMIGQLNRMKQHGVKVACYLLSYGVETQSLTNYISEAATTPELQKIAISSFTKLFAIKNLIIPWGILEVSTELRVPETVAFLVDVYLNESFPASARSSALGAAQDLIYGRSNDDEPATSVHKSEGDRSMVLAALAKLMTSDLATDRWDAVDMILHVGGTDSLDSVIGGLKADLTSYARYTPDDEIEMPDYIIIELCSGKLKKEADKARPVLESWLKKGDHVQKAVSTLCLKALGNPASVGALKALAEDTTTLEYLFFSKEEYAKRKPLLDEERIPAMTVGLLALNAIDGIAMTAEIATETKGGKLSAEDSKLKTVSALSVIAFVGDT